MGCLPQLALMLAGPSRLRTEGGSCSSEVAVLAVAAFAPSSAGGGLEEAAPGGHFLVSIYVRNAV